MGGLLLADWAQSVDEAYCIDAVVHGMMEIEGICGRYRRAPYTSLSDEQMEILREYRKGLKY